MHNQYKLKSNNKCYIILILFVFIFGFVENSFAEEKELNLNPELNLNLNPLDTLNTVGLKPISTSDLSDRFKFNLPFNLNKINISTNIPLSPVVNESKGLPDINLKQFLTPKDVSSNDLIGALKAITVFVIEIFLVVISIVVQILKLILGFLR